MPTRQDLIIGSCYQRRHAAHLADRLVQAAMQSVGHDWRTGAIDVHHEHRASRIVESILLDIIGQSRMRAANRFGAGAVRPRAFGATPEGCLYTIAGLLCELSLIDLGWEVINLGCNLPLDSLAKAARAHQPRLVWLSVNYLEDEKRFIEEYKSFFNSIEDLNCAVALAGGAVGPELRTELTYASFCDRMIHFEEFAKRLFAGTVGPSERATKERPTPG